MTVRAGRQSPIFSTWAAFIALKSLISLRKTFDVYDVGEIRPLIRFRAIGWRALVSTLRIVLLLEVHLAGLVRLDLRVSS